MVIGLWSIASPLFSNPDEPAHVVKAAAVVRGQPLGHDIHTPRGDTVTEVRIPEGLVSPGTPCYGHRPTMPASCQKLPSGSDHTVVAGTLAGHYQPLYYAIVGVGSLLSQGELGLYLMRIISALLSAGFLASALMSLGRFGMLARLGLGIAVTPMVLFMGSGVNPSGFEITTAACVWATLIAVLATPERTDRRLMVRLGIAAAALVLTRSLSPLWLAVIVIVTILATGWQPVRVVLRRRAAQVCVGTTLIATIAATAWIYFAKALTLRPDSHPPRITARSALVRSFDESPYRIKQMVGIFGWLDTPVPLWTSLVWAVGVGVVVLLCLCTARRLPAVALIVLLCTVVVLPVLIEASQEASLGLVWQGRYTLPIAIGVPILAARFTDASALPVRAARRLCGVITVSLASGYLFAFLWNLKRNTVGVHHGFGLFHPDWHPPVPPWLLLLLFLAALVPFTALFYPFRNGPAEREPTGGTPIPNEAHAAVEGVRP